MNQSQAGEESTIDKELEDEIVRSLQGLILVGKLLSGLPDYITSQKWWSEAMTTWLASSERLSSLLFLVRYRVPIPTSDTSAPSGNETPKKNDSSVSPQDYIDSVQLLARNCF